MRVLLVPVVDIEPAEREAISTRVRLSEHEDDEGAIKAWGKPEFESSLYVTFDMKLDATRVPFGLVQAAGEKTSVVTWWIDSRHRGQHYGIPMIDELAKVLKNRGTTKVEVRVATRLGIYNKQSFSLYDRLKWHFRASAA